MPKFELTCGVQSKAIRLFAYGPEGIGKSTLAAQLPSPVFIDVEGGTNQLPVARLPKPSSWMMLMDEIQAVQNSEIPDCKSLVIDTADASEALCIANVCAENGVTGIEKMPYGKGYVFVKEKWCKMLDALGEVVDHGVNVVLLGHSRLDKFERPDESGAYDRYSPKLIDSKRASIAAATKEWCDMVLFLDYKIYVEEQNGKAKAHGGRRIIHTTHHPCWDAKNRFGLPDEMPLNDETVATLCNLMTIAEQPVAPREQAAMAEPVQYEKPIVGKSVEEVTEPRDPRDEYPAEFSALVDLMKGDGITDEMLRRAVGAKGYRPRECPVDQYPADFVAWLTSVWPSFVTFAKELD